MTTGTRDEELKVAFGTRSQLQYGFSEGQPGS